MSRARKLLIVALVLSVGLGLAWPFRKSANDKANKKNYDAVAQSANGSRAARATHASPPRQRPSLPGPLTPPVAATMTSTGDARDSASSGQAVASFDLANHPALAAPIATERESPVTPPVPPQPQRSTTEEVSASPRRSLSSPKPAYSTIERDRVFDAAETHEQNVRHVVQNSDTLEKLAKRYLGDEARALEIFDLNRDVLDNPHLLPIDAELRIPADARATID